MGFCWKTKGYGEVRQEKGVMNRKVRQNKVVVWKGLGKH